MNAKERATVLYHTFYNTDYHSNSIGIREYLAKENAIKCVDEILSLLEIVYDQGWSEISNENVGEKTKYYLQVKKELQKF